MRILSKRQLKELVLYSPQHVQRLEKAGQFPLRVRLGPSRVGWVEAEVLDWLEVRLASREAPSDPNLKFATLCCKDGANFRFKRVTSNYIILV